MGRVGCGLDGGVGAGGKGGAGGGGKGGIGGLGMGAGTSNGLCIATGSTHASVITGADDGSVTVTNPVRKLLYPRAGRWGLVLFRHEYVRGREREGEAGEKGGNGEGDAGGRVRITEAYKAREASMRHGAGSGSGSRSAAGRVLEGVMVATVWEEEGMVRCVGWGKEVGVGGWVGVGMGSGLVRVEDVGVSF